MIVVVTDDPNDAKLVAWALGLLARQLRADGSALPRSLEVPIVHASRPAAVLSGQERTISPVLPVRVDDGAMDELLTYSGAGRALGGVSERTVRRLVADRSLPVVAVGRRRFVRRADVEQFMTGTGRVA